MSGSIISAAQAQHGEWGGNLDICPGNCILLPVFLVGALFYLSDTEFRRP